MTRNGFSLVELSIVLVILGLLTGGILGGQALIRAAELRAVSTEQGRYLTAVQTFRDKYFGLPGDFRDATRFWGRAAATGDCVTNSSAAVASPGACDGGGDGRINNAAAASQSGDEFQFWKHLALAGLIEGTYSGLAGSGGLGHIVPATNAPRSRLSNAAWYTAQSGLVSTSILPYLTYNNYLGIGAATTTTYSYGAVLKPEEAWNIDTKIDDGRPSYGKVIGIYWNDACSTANTGVTAATNLDAVYMLSSTANACSLIFRDAF
ncbi:MAG: hypothetical protein DI582_07990 [Azospirillum brasilense]|nr:MAG: hypothetical protein DI582_07990 [Azospirillum brasilense]